MTLTRLSGTGDRRPHLFTDGESYYCVEMSGLSVLTMVASARRCDEFRVVSGGEIVSATGPRAYEECVSKLAEFVESQRVAA